jgi:scyllo-inositol 2-dehydrogenase (NADP+)
MSPSKPRVLLLTGGPIHNWEACAPIVDALLKTRFDVTHTHDVADLAHLAEGKFAAAVLLYTRIELPDDLLTTVENFVKNGGGLVALHGTTAFKDQPKLAELLGCRFAGHGPVFDFEVRPSNPAHPVVARTNPFKVTDELYLVDSFADYDTFAVAHWQGADHPMGYERKLGKGRVIYLANGHDPRSLGDRHVQRLIERATRVACGETFDATLTAGVLGYGGAFNMGKSHATALNGQLGCKTIAVCDLDPKRTAQAKVELGEDIATSNDPEAFLRDGDFDLCIQILPHNIHAEYCIKASAAGKHVVTEKPFCITLEEADAMIAAANQSGKMLSAYHNRRWDNDFLTVLDTVRRGDIGQVFRVDAASAGYAPPRTWWRASKEISGGAMYDWGAHYCDWMLNIMNKPIESIVGDFQKRKWHSSTNEDYTYALVRFADGTTATLEQGSLAAISRGGWRVLGTEGGLQNAGPHQALTLRKFDPQFGMVESQLQPKGPDTAASYYQNVANHLIMGEELVVKAEEARRAIGVIHLAEQSSKQGGKPLALPGEDAYADKCAYLTPWH